MIIYDDFLPPSLYFKYFFGCIVWVSNGSLDLIWFILAHVICIVVTHVPVSMPSLAKYNLFIYLFIYHKLI